jgi:glycosyltransferase involved in cell wall biosynthesis
VTVLVLVKHYLPGYKSGGPLRSVANLIEHLGDEMDFVVLTWDRDSGDACPYPGITPGARHRVGKAQVVYIAPHVLSPWTLRQLVRDIRPDLLYLNSFFARTFGMLPVLLRRYRQIPRTPAILAPRGEFSPGALSLNPGRKRAFLSASNLLGLHRDVTWQASSVLEAADIRRCIASAHEDARSGADPVIVAPDLLAAESSISASVQRRRKAAGALRVVFLSRLVPKKNLHGALQMLAGVRGRVDFEIYGPIEDTAYWERCQQLIRTLPAGIHVRYRGAVGHARVASILSDHDLFFLPTLGENYGHVIIEALLAGCPVLLSDQTPWHQLERLGVGWDLSLDKPERFRAVLERCIHMDAAAWDGWSTRAANFARRHAADPTTVNANRLLFHAALRSGSAAGAKLRPSIAAANESDTPPPVLNRVVASPPGPRG